ncbi:MAG: shikimate kinase [Lentisphaeria bacterium]|nr:shikimate kinase [Lentisphaeria bacterium]
MTDTPPILLAVTGNPVLSNKTPQMINAALRQVGRPGQCLRLAADSAEEAVQLARLLDVQGLSVTSPFERDILPLLSAVDASAAAAGTANVVTVGDTGLTGFHVEPGNDSSEIARPFDWAGAAFARMIQDTAYPRDIMAEALELHTKGFPGRVALIGFMGCGKTRNGRRLARETGWAFKDMDSAIEQTAGRSIPDIFQTDGEEAFRKLETQVLETLASSIETVVSCGGGVVTRPENRRLLQKHFLCVWLVASMDTIIARTTGSDRPLLACENPRAKAEALYQDRRMMYAACADLVVSTEPTCRRQADEKIHAEIAAAFPE